MVNAKVSKKKQPSAQTGAYTAEFKESWRYNIIKYWAFYLMVIPCLVYILIFKYVPILGCIVAFQDYSVFKGILASPFVGLKHFNSLLDYYNFWQILRNTLILGLMKTVLTFPVPLILSVMLNEIRSVKLKKTVQTAVYIPHFLSWVVVGGLVFDFFSMSGIFNKIRSVFGMESILIMQKESWFRPVFVVSSIWKEAGWGTVVYMAAMSGIDPELYEAAQIDGANRFQRVTYITIPFLIPTALTLFLLGIGGFLELGFDQVYNLSTPMTQSVADIFDTYVYRIGIQNAQYSHTTAIGLFQSVVGLILVVTFNKLANKLTENGGLW